MPLALPGILRQPNQPAATLTVRAKAADGTVKEIPCRVRIDTPVELDYYRNGGILQTVLRKMLD